MSNRFENCKSFVDLQKVLGESTKFTSLTSDELERLFAIFEANKPDDAVLPTYPLDTKGYEYICNVVKDEVLTVIAKEMAQKEEEFTMKNNNIIERIKGMETDKTIKTIISDVAEKAKDAKVKIVSAGKANVDSLSKSCDEEISTLTTALNKTIKAVAVGTADPELGEELANIFARLMSTNSIKSAIDAGRAADEAVFDWYKRLSLIDPDHVTFKEAWAFTREIGLDENGEPVNQFRGVFTILLGGLNWIACWLVKKCHAALDSIGEIGKAIGFAVATVFGVAKALLKLAIKIATFVVVNGITAIISICAAIVNTIKKVGSKILSKKEQEELDDLEEEIEEYEEAIH